MEILDFPSSRMTASRRCHHHVLDFGDFAAEHCPDSDRLEWTRAGEACDPAEALAAIFGQFALFTILDGVRTPGPSVFVYTPRRRRERSRLERLPLGRWLLAAPGLWLTRDESSLLLSPDDPVLAANLARNG